MLLFVIKPFVPYMFLLLQIEQRQPSADPLDMEPLRNDIANSFPNLLKLQFKMCSEIHESLTLYRPSHGGPSS